MIELIIYFNYIISAKSDTKYIINYNFSRIRIDSYKKKTLTFHNLIIVIKWVIHKNKNNSYFNIYLEEANQQANQKTEIFVNIGIF